MLTKSTVFFTKQKYVVSSSFSFLLFLSTYKLYYFNFRGRGETPRLIFAAAGQKFEDVRVEREQWSAHKAEMPLGQMPVLEYDGTKIPQSIAISRFLAKQFQLAGKDNFEQAKVDAVADTVSDMVAVFISIRREQDEIKKQELRKKFRTEDLPKNLQNLEVLGKLYGNGGPFFVGNQLTWVDVYFYDMAESIVQTSENDLDKYPWLKQNCAEVEKQPRIAEYLKSRPKTAM